MAISNFSTSNAFLLLSGSGPEQTFLVDFEGGLPAAEVVERSGPFPGASKELGRAAPTPLLMSLALPLPAGMARLAAEVATDIGGAYSGSVVLADMNFKPRAEMTFDGALATELRLPRLDAAGRSLGVLGLALQAEKSRLLSEPKSSLQQPAPTGRRWMVNNFELGIDGVDCSRVLSVDLPRIVRVALASDTGGGRLRRPTLAPGRSTLGPMTVRFHMGTDTGWAKWADSMAQGQTEERAAKVTLLDTDRRRVLGTIELRVGLRSLQIERIGLGGQSGLTLVAELYVETIRLDLQAK